MSEKLRVGILGDQQGMVGQRFISLLENHHGFEVDSSCCKSAFSRQGL